MLFYTVVFFHVVACVVLIMVILLQSGRGGGLSEMLGGGVQQTQKLLGTQTNEFMTKATTYCAIVFILTSITLGVMTSRRSRSLLEGAELKPFFDQTTTAVPAGTDLPESGIVKDYELEEATAAAAKAVDAAADAVKATVPEDAPEAPVLPEAPAETPANP
ncbi:MAG: preprotein translocase subunit SecG [Candidatus Omnitrophica bacterium]|nr:preprotein translocase subunit SecG [Candidatus Omnitrophota bacterium]